MKEDLQKDGFEKFLKKSFEGYEESPSAGLWDKIDSGLSTPPIAEAAAKTASVFKTWWAIGIAAMFVGVVATQFFYFQNRLNELTQKVDNQEIKTSPAPARNSESEGVLDTESFDESPIPQSVDVEKSLIPNTNLTEENLTGNNLIKTEVVSNSKAELQEILEEKVAETKKEEVAETKIGSNSATKRNNTSVSENNKQVRYDELPPFEKEVGNLSFEENEVEQIENLPVSEKSGTENISDFSEIESTKERDRTIANIDFLEFENSQLNIGDLDWELPAASAAVGQNKIEPVQNKRKSWSVAGNFGVFHTQENIKGDIRENFRPSPLHDRAPIGHQNKNITGQTIISGAEIEIDLENGWSLASGLSYRKDEFSSSNRTKIKFKDLNGASTGPLRAEFPYFENTTAGVYRLEAKIESGDPIAPNDELTILADSRRTAEYLSLPFLVKYQREVGNWSFDIKSGVLTNFLIKNDFQVTKFDIEDQGIRLKDKDCKKLNLPGVSDTNLDALVSVGVEYDFTDHLSFALSPTILFDLTQKNQLPPNLHSNFLSLGINAGVRYSF